MKKLIIALLLLTACVSGPSQGYQITRLVNDSIVKVDTARMWWEYGRVYTKLQGQERIIVPLNQEIRIKLIDLAPE